MKALFGITVLIAGIYLFIQQEGFDKLKTYLPQHQIDKSAETLLASVNQNVTKNVTNTVTKSINQSVDQKLEQFKKTLLTEKDEQINALEKQLASLQAQFAEKATQQAGSALAKVALEKTAQESAPALQVNEHNSQDFPSEPAFAKTQYLNSGSSATNLAMATSSASNIDEKETSKQDVIRQKAIKRQANLQDIAARMNKTSLLALTH